MMLKHYMLIIYTRWGFTKRGVTDKSPLERAVDLHSKCKDIEEIEVYKFISKSCDYKYMCTIKFDRGLLHV